MQLGEETVAVLLPEMQGHEESAAVKSEALGVSELALHLLVGVIVEVRLVVEAAEIAVIGEWFHLTYLLSCVILPYFSI